MGKSDRREAALESMDVGMEAVSSRRNETGVQRLWDSIITLLNLDFVDRHFEPHRDYNIGDGVILTLVPIF